MKDEQSVRNVFTLLVTFGKISGLKLNVSKSQALWLGPKGYVGMNHLMLNGLMSLLKFWVFIFSYNEKAAEERNFEPKIKNLKSILNVWKTRQLTLAGKIRLIKTSGLSQFFYLASVTTIPEEIIHKIDKILYDFFVEGW